MTVAIEAAFRGNKATMATYFEEIKEWAPSRKDLNRIEAVSSTG